MNYIFGFDVENKPKNKPQVPKLDLEPLKEKQKNKSKISIYLAH